jgi:hypothetical protein
MWINTFEKMSMFPRRLGSMKRTRGRPHAITAVHFRAGKEAFILHRQSMTLSHDEVSTMFNEMNMTPTTNMRIVLKNTSMPMAFENAKLVGTRVAIPECGFSNPKFDTIDAFEWKGRKVEKTFGNSVTYGGEIVDFVEGGGNSWKCVVHFEDNEILECEFNNLHMIPMQSAVAKLPPLHLLSTVEEQAFKDNVLSPLIQISEVEKH